MKCWSFIEYALAIVGGVVLLAVVNAVCETFSYAINLEIEESKKRAARLDGYRRNNEQA